MAPSALPKDLLAYLSATSTTVQYATDALEEWILYRRSKGDTLFDVSVGLVELEEKVSRALELPMSSEGVKADELDSPTSSSGVRWSKICHESTRDHRPDTSQRRIPYA